MNMRAFDLSPLYRASVGFDRLAGTLNALNRSDPAVAGYPPFNVEKTGEDSYRISLAVAGFGEDEIRVETREGQLTIAASREESAGREREFLYRGIAERAFEKRFELDANVRAVSATMENGLLHVDLVREIPEALKPRRIDISRVEKVAG